MLLAEDTEFFRVIETDYLTAFGCRVDVVSDGASAWDRLNHGAYDILLTDLDMPRMNGFELIRRLRDSDKLRDLPVIALTALHMNQSVRNEEDADADAFEAKLDRERLRMAMAAVLQRRQTAGQRIPALTARTGNKEGK